MAMIQLTDPAGGPVSVNTVDVVMIFFSSYLSPSKAKSNIVLGGSILSFAETPTEVAAKIGAVEKLLKLTLPDTGVPGRAKGAIWIRKDLITRVTSVPSGGATVSVRGQHGPTRVTESKAVIDAAIAAP